MKVRGTSLVAVGLALAGALAPAQSAAQAPRTMTVQGILRNAEGQPVEGTIHFQFELRTPIRTVWMESQSANLRAGLFTLTLGSTTPIDPALFAGDAPLSLRVTVAGEAMDPIPLTSVAYAFRAFSAESADNYTGDIEWGQLVGVPPGFADGTDDGASYSAGTGLTLTGSTFAVDSSVVQLRVTGVCPAGQSIRAIAMDGSVTCEVDDSGATYSAGPGLTLTGTTFAVDTSTIQARVTGTCAPGQAIRAIAMDGSVTCEVDDSGATYSAGPGLTLTGTTFAVDTSTIQARVTGTCPAGQAIRAIAMDGSVTCEPDDDTTYSAGPGLTLTGTTFAVNTSTIQARVTGTCPAGQAIRAIATDGTVTCQPVAGSAALGESPATAATSCAALLSSRPGVPNGIYWLRPTTASSAFQAYCDMTTDGGGWTLVWSNLRGTRGKPTTELQWDTAINTLPRVSGPMSANLEQWMVYTGLRHWSALAPGSQLLYSWANDYGSPIDQSYRCTFGLLLPNYNLGLSSCVQLVGSVPPGLFTYHNSRPFSTYDRDNDSSGVNCASYYSNTPFWYGACWSGSINGGGEFSGDGYLNGAYWTDSARTWGNDAGQGAGNGWIFVR
jgi:hypothetical protein